MPTALNDLMAYLKTVPTDWGIRRVVLFRPHERHFPEVRDAAGKVVRPAETVRVTERDIPDIAARANRRIDDSGTLDAFCLGHRNFEAGFPEEKQPPLLGFYRNYRAETVRPDDGTPYLGLVADECVPKAKAAEYKLYTEYPYRSAEYHPQLGVHGAAALKRVPALNLGTVYTYSDGTRTYEMGAVMADGTATNDSDWGPDDDKDYPAFESAMKPYAARAKKFWRKYESGMAGVGPVNGTQPAPVAYQAEFDARIKSLEASAAAANRRALEAECGAQLDKLAPLVKFSRERELKTLVAYQSDAERGQHLTYMADHYERLPTGGMIRTYEGEVRPAGAADKGPTAAPPDFGKVMKYMADHAEMGLKYDQAEALVKAGK